MKINTFDIDNRINVAYCEIPDLMEHSDSGCIGMRYLTANVRSDSRRREIFTTNLLIRDVFGDGSHLCHYPNGAPYLENVAPPTPVISLSHCRDMAALAYANEPVGIDVEEMAERIMRVRERVQNADEQRYTGNSIVLNTIDWTAKEALFKAIPEEGVDFARDLAIDMSTTKANAIVNEFTATAFGRRYKLVSRLLDDRVLTVAFKL
ncbi:MAG: 4'-phosphopantetheinyl transferase superfamily protein [Bacteroidales bacterium]|nr:4'-phosphopantetheinyl transferase superfamily protein [Bacteroidales bacterium]